MANWCSTSYVFEGSKEEIVDLFKKLEELEKRKSPLVENGFGNLFLGCVINLFGGDWELIDCRGEINWMELSSQTVISLSTESAWGDKPDVWNFVLKHYSSIKYYFCAEELGCSYFVTNDINGKFFPDRYQIDQWDQGVEYYHTKKEVLADVSARLGKTISNWKNMEKEIEIFNRSHECNTIYVNRFSLVDPIF